MNLGWSLNYKNFQNKKLIKKPLENLMILKKFFSLMGKKILK